MPWRASFASTSPRVGRELFVTNSDPLARGPQTGHRVGARRRSARRRSQTTPSRSSTQAHRGDRGMPGSGSRASDRTRGAPLRTVPRRPLRPATRRSRRASPRPPYDVIDAASRAALAERAPAQRRAHRPPRRPAPTAYDGAAAAPRRLAGRRRARRDRDPSLYVLPHDLHRRGRTAHPHTPGVIGALELDPPGRGRHPPPRAHHAEGQERPARPAAGHDGQPVRRCGACRCARPVELLDPSRPSRPRLDRRDGVDHELWPIDDPARVGRDRRGRRPPPGGHRRRPPPLRDQPRLPRRAARDRRRRARRRAAADLRRRAGRRRARGAADPPPGDGLPDGFDRAGALGRVRSTRRARAADADPVDDRADRPTARWCWSRRTAWYLDPAPSTSRPGGASTRAGSTARSRPSPPTTSIFQHGVDEVSRGQLRSAPRPAFLLRPAAVAQIVEIAHGGERMPPKTTFFSPKPRTGVVFRLLDE